MAPLDRASGCRDLPRIAGVPRRTSGHATRERAPAGTAEPGAAGRRTSHASGSRGDRRGSAGGGSCRPRQAARFAWYRLPRTGVPTLAARGGGGPFSDRRSVLVAIARIVTASTDAIAPQTVRLQGYLRQSRASVCGALRRLGGRCSDAPSLRRAARPSAGLFITAGGSRSFAPVFTSCRVRPLPTD